MKKIFFIALVALIAVVAARAQTVTYQDVVMQPGQYGLLKGVPNAKIAVCTSGATISIKPCSPLASLSGPNPLTTDAQGNYSFSAAPGSYVIQIYGATIQGQQIVYVTLPCDSSLAPGATGACGPNLALPVSIANGGTGAASAASARTSLGAAASGANSDITSLSGLSTALPLSEGGTAATSAAAARSNLGAAASGANSDITSLAGLTTPLAVASGGTGTSSPSLTAGLNIGITGTWPDQTIGVTGILAVANGGTGSSTAGSNIPSALPVPIADGGTGTALPALAAGTGISITGTWPNNTVTNSSSYAALADPLPVAHGGTGSASPSLVAGTGISITGSWPNQTVTNTSSGLSEYTGNQTGLTATATGTQLVTLVTPSSDTMYRVIVMIGVTTAEAGCTTKASVKTYLTWTDALSGTVQTETGSAAFAPDAVIVYYAPSQSVVAPIVAKGGTAIQAGLDVLTAASICSTYPIINTYAEALP